MKHFPISILILLLLIATATRAQKVPGKKQWVDSVFNSLNNNEKIGQLFMVPLSPTATDAEVKAMVDKIKNNEIGGVILPKKGMGGPKHQIHTSRTFQNAATIPLFIAIETGSQNLGLSLDSVTHFPPAALAGALRSDSLVFEAGRYTGQQMKMLGINFNFTTNAVIRNATDTAFSSAFGDNRINVTRKAIAFAQGLQSQGINTCTKEFPLKGITVTDIREGIPVTQFTTDTIQIYPYRKLFADHVPGVMPAMTDIPLLYQHNHLVKRNDFGPQALIALNTAEWIRSNLKYRGLVFTEISRIQHTANSKPLRAGEAETLAIQAGNDILISGADITPALRRIKRFIRKEKQYRIQIDSSVRKILALKYDAGLWQKPENLTDNIILRTNSPALKGIQQKLYEGAVTIIRNQNDVLPLANLETKHIAYLTADASAPSNSVYDYLNKYTHVVPITLNAGADISKITEELAQYNVVIAGIFSAGAGTERLTQLLQQQASMRTVIICDFTDFQTTASLPEATAYIKGYTTHEAMLRAIPEVIFGGLKANGTLPATMAAGKEGSGKETKALGRLTYSFPEDAGMDSRILQRIDTIAKEAIRIGATPGCQVLVARHGKVVYQKDFGYFMYDRKTPVTDATLYDLASVTKVTATLQTALFMYDHGLIDLDRKVSYYLPDLRKTNKKDITLIDMLTHQAGLLPFIPLWPQTMKDTTFLPLFYSRIKNERYSLQVSPNLYASPNIRDSVWVWITKSKLGEKPARTPYPYKYSDLGFLILQHLAEKILNQPIDEFLQQNLYEPLGAYSTGFTPLNRFSKQTIAPTEDDKIFRRTFIEGTVHDERAAMMGGVAGHAGLFSTANDLAKLCQMLLQEGYYGGYQYYKPETVRLFTDRQFETSRRGIGWDKPVQSDWSSPTSLLASPRTFGHTGFTGTCIWVDPEFDLVYIFLSNRVYPDRNNKLSQANIRSRIQDAIYQSVFNFSLYENTSVTGCP